MRAFPNANTSHDWKCIICGTNKDEPVVLIAKEGTGRGGIVEAEQVHVACLNFTIRDFDDGKVIYQRIEKGAK